MVVRFVSSFIVSLLYHGFAESFTVLGPRNALTSSPAQRSIVGPSRDLGILSSSEGDEPVDPVDQLSEERKANLFQFLLRDLEVEGVPLLGCDADQPTTFLAALYTTMAEMSANDVADRACLVLENIPVGAIRTMVDDFIVLKTQRRLMDSLPELERFSLSLVGKGVGAAVLIETIERTEEEKMQYAAMKAATPEPDELKWTAAMKTFVSRMVVSKEVCPSTTENAAAPTGLEEKGVQPGPIGYRPVGAFDACDAMSAFWYCICELLSVPDDQVSSTVLCLPPVPEGEDASKVLERFSVVAELISRSLFLYRGEDLFEVLHMHPLYDRDLVHPKDAPAPGHLPPTSWLRSMIKANGNEEEAEKLTDDELALQNYQRRSPLPAVVIKRVSQLDAAATPESGMVMLDFGDGKMEMASGLPTYSRNVIRMVGEGKESLQSALDAEIAQTK